MTSFLHPSLLPYPPIPSLLLNADSSPISLPPSNSISSLYFMKVMIMIMIEYCKLRLFVVGYYLCGGFSIADVQIILLPTAYLFHLKETCINTLHQMYDNRENGLSDDLLWRGRRQRMIGIRNIDEMGIMVVGDVKPSKTS